MAFPNLTHNTSKIPSFIPNTINFTNESNIINFSALTI
ncbi:hypothetical protein SORDD30_00289 [Streptococcus oralis]|uniref:Uncharacterized protein n=1 Tax=Streptococcus oralis TaxID=1303 RepID=A0A139QD46_STROR|nr:hypothetical protein SORDD30_00289 [Streptococcus oralis]